MAVESNRGKKELNPYKRVRIVDKIGNEPVYELVFLLRSDMSSEDVSTLFGKIKSRIADKGGVVKDVSYWGLRSLRYRIKRMKKAHFYCAHFTGSRELCVDIDKFLRNNANILRFLNIRLQFLSAEKPAIMVNLEKDISDGAVVYDEKYIISL